MIIMLFYDASANQSVMHMHLRSEAGALTGRMECCLEDAGKLENLPDWDGSCTVARDGLFKKVEGSCHVNMVRRGLLSSRGSIAVSGSWHAANGVSFMRSTGIIK